MFRPPLVPRLRLAPCYRPPLWLCNTQIRIFATHKSLPLPRRISSPREGKPTPASTPPRGVRKDVDELKKRYKLIPDRWRAYAQLARVDKPIGTFLLYFPCAWTISMASYSLSVPYQFAFTQLALFGTGAFLMRGAGCTINDLWDRKLDTQVERTRERPLASGMLKVGQAFGFLGVQLAGAAAVLAQLNWYSILLGAASLSIVAIYPLMKRITYWPQFVLGLAFNWGTMLGWSAITGSVNWDVCLPLYIAGIYWTLAYDTIYAHQDKHDDARVGIRSTARLFGQHSRLIISLFSVAMISLLVYAGMKNDQGAPYYMGVTTAAGQLARIAWSVDFDSRASCSRAFSANGRVGGAVVVGALADYLISTYYLRPHQLGQQRDIASSDSVAEVGERVKEERENKVPSIPPPPSWWPSWWPAAGWGWFAWIWKEPEEGAWETGV